MSDIGLGLIAVGLGLALVAVPESALFAVPGTALFLWGISIAIRK